MADLQRVERDPEGDAHRGVEAQAGEGGDGSGACGEHQGEEEQFEHDRADAAEGHQQLGFADERDLESLLVGGPEVIHLQAQVVPEDPVDAAAPELPVAGEEVDQAEQDQVIRRGRA